MIAVGPIGIASGGGGGGGRGALGEGGRRHPQGLLVISIANFSIINDDPSLSSLSRPSSGQGGTQPL